MHEDTPLSAPDGSPSGRAKAGSPIARWLASAPAPLFIGFAIAAAFTTYFSMYAFRKPFAAARYTGLEFWGIELKTALVISQILGYTLSKYIGIKVCSEMTRERRARALISLILAAELALVLFAVLPAGGKVLALFLNGIPLGMVWGLVVWYLEGRRTSEILLAGLSGSFIIASGIVKDFGRYLMSSFEISEWWMPAATGLCFLPLFLVAVWFLNQIPPPDEGDMLARVEREPMHAAHRHAFLRRFLPGLIMLFLAYFFLTAYRDFRDNYGVEILTGLGYGDDSAIFTKTEAPVMCGVLGALALLNLIKDNRLGLLGAYCIMTAGVVLLGASTLLFDAGLLSGYWWMILVGLGSYLAYVPYGSVLFDRLIASTRVIGTAVFTIYVADAIGYTGSVGVQLYKDFFQRELPRLEFFKGFTYFFSALGFAMMLASCAYFLRFGRPAPGPAAGRRQQP